MAQIRIPKVWEMSERLATPEDAYLNRRKFMQALGIAGAGVVLGCADPQAPEAKPVVEVKKISEPPSGVYPAKRNEKWKLDREVTPEDVAGSYNNFYEFTTDKERVKDLVDRFETRPWEVEVSGLVDRPKVYDLDDLVRRMPLEERLYRFRCVEAWAMAVPWTGFPMKALINEVQPKSSARYVRMVTFQRPEQAPGQKSQPWYPWPYFEALTMEEAMNELTLLGTGIYGHALPKQHGAPIRLVAPWKYGFKSIKSIVSIEFTDKQPPTFWNKLAPSEYDFWANVNPNVPHPRWSQATERLISTGERVPSQLYNGYGEYVAHLYG
ncbi:MAG: protein-methionine-sulfoxide reductase catalytic subunit MsrP [bacterium]|nr:protein-methionine-sulfoxide reductase catalytic subunit MsrP [bacterium]